MAYLRANVEAVPPGAVDSWPNRDPIEEAGGLGQYVFVRSNPVSFVDGFGLRCQELFRPPEDILRILEKAWTLTLKTGLEQGGNIYTIGADMYYDKPALGTDASEIILPVDPNAVAQYHTHTPSSNAEFGNPPSFKDATRAAAHYKIGRCEYIDSGSYIYAICNDDRQLCNACSDPFRQFDIIAEAERRYASDMERLRGSGSAASSAHILAMELGVRRIAIQCGLCVYKSPLRDPKARNYRKESDAFFERLR